jgi:hypothetical protein
VVSLKKCDKLSAWRTMLFRQPDAVALLAIPLALAAFWAGGVVFPTICLCLAGTMVVYVIAGHDELAWKQRVAMCVLAAVLDLAVVSYLYKVNLARILREQVAPLDAATLPSPVSRNCPIPKGAVAIYLGNSASVVTKFPHVVFRAHSEDVFVIDRDSAGLLISFKVFDDRGNAVARLERNIFLAMNPTSHVERPSRSNLIVFDDRGSKVLDVQFLNPQAVKITGLLRYPGVDPVIISEKYLGTGGSISPPACRTGTDADFLFK